MECLSLFGCMRTHKHAGLQHLCCACGEFKNEQKECINGPKLVSCYTKKYALGIQFNLVSKKWRPHAGVSTRVPYNIEKKTYCRNKKRFTYIFTHEHICGQHFIAIIPDLWCCEMWNVKSNAVMVWGKSTRKRALSDMDMDATIAALSTNQVARVHVTSSLVNCIFSYWIDPHFFADTAVLIALALQVVQSW
jgi:hypothetical protein